MVKITAAVAVKPKAPLEFRELELADPEGNEILVRTVATGICHTDLLLRDGIFGPPAPVIPGHEGVGIVEAIGADVQSLKVGDHVALSQSSCGFCADCRRSHPMNCQNYTQYNLTGLRPNGKKALLCDEVGIGSNFVGQSSFATHILATENNAALLPKENFDLTNAAPLGCGMATGAGTVINAMKPEIGSTIAVFGAGAVGMAAVMAAKVRRCSKIIIVDLNQQRLDMAKELGATHAINGEDTDVVEQIHALTGGGADFAIDAVGIIPVILNSIKCTRAGGHVVLLGLDALGKDIPIPLDLMVFNRKIQGAILGDQIPQLFIPQMVELNQAGLFPFQKLITKYPFEKINEAIADAEAGRVIKPVIVFN
ncbi:NAD(P)-dependent alcohol dehydrogenase (plasmid) [Agrobacterium salinitolerans]|uniref:NAD(P)-dependent alcohol dehydrogenase n=1 Tax=Agrobacterium salinitolerans TaxID=1183413 RepID=A0A4Z1R7J6_9HYPH|nr:MULTISPECIES: NAD(P)-dependent alcohol dehydrogenase [Agrobacterium]MDH6298057.1 aryl-alcohol dehydrogenase [Agrobacterium fabrum]UYZ10839.1 NAD(P)-dependent alcohol dehydrogenase [Agrobacterium salinitolerans]